MNKLKDILNEDFFKNKLGLSEKNANLKKRLVNELYERFKSIFQNKSDGNMLSFVTVPNRVELLGKHTDYQGGKTLLITGPKSFTAIGCKSKDNLTELINLEEVYGKTIFTHDNYNIEIKEKGFGWQYSYSVFKRLLKNLRESNLPPISPVKTVFYGNIPIGGGTSGSSAKVILDFLTVTLVNNILENDNFRKIIIDNGRLAGVKYGQKDVDDYKLALSMYIANFENGLNFGNLHGDRGVGTFGGSEDHTAILLGEKGKLLFCRYCPTEVLDKPAWPEGYTIVVAYSGKKAEKTTNARESYNLLSLYAKESVKILNSYFNLNNKMLRDFFTDIPPEKRAETAYQTLKTLGYPKLAERSYQFFMEEFIIDKAVNHLKKKEMDNFGDLINLSHYLSRNYLKNITDEIEFLQRSAINIGAIGASGFGAGFGGSCYALIKESQKNDFVEKWEKTYLDKFLQYRDIAKFEVYKPGNGAYWEVLNDR